MKNCPLPNAFSTHMRHGDFGDHCVLPKGTSMFPEAPLHLDNPESESTELLHGGLCWCSWEFHPSRGEALGIRNEVYLGWMWRHERCDGEGWGAGLESESRDSLSSPPPGSCSRPRRPP